MEALDAVRPAPDPVNGEHPAATLGQELLRLRKSHGMSLRKMAQLLGLNAHSGLVDYERDYRIPPVELLREYQRVVRADGEVLLRLHQRAVRARAARHPEPLVTVLPPQPAPSYPAGGPPAAELVRAAARRARVFAQHAPPPLDAELLDQLLDEVRALAGDWPRRPDTGVLAELAGAQERLFALLARGHAPATARRLHWVAAVLGGLLARASLEFGESAAATVQAHSAFVCADRAGHPGLLAWVRGTQSVIAYWSDRLPEAIRYARSGAALAAGAEGTAPAWLPACEARAWARLGDADRALALIEQAELAWDRARPDEVDALGGQCRTTRPALHYLAADALSWLPGQGERAERHCRLALAGYADESGPDWDFGYAACVSAVLAAVLLDRGDPEPAGQALAPLLTLPQDARPFTVLRSIGRVGDALRRLGTAADTTPLQDQLRHFATP